MTTFRRLAAWRRAHALAMHVHDLTESAGFENQPGLAQDMRHVAIDIPGHVAQGSGYSTASLFAQCLEHALAAARRLHSHAVLARDLRTLSTSEFARLDARVDEVCRILVGLRRTVLGEAPRTPTPRPAGPAPIAAAAPAARKSRPRQRARDDR